MTPETNTGHTHENSDPEDEAWEEESVPLGDEVAESQRRAVEQLDAKLWALIAREAARDLEMERQRQELARLRQENADLRREADETRLETALLKQRVQDHTKHTRMAVDQLWGLVYAGLTAVCVVAGLFTILESLAIITGAH